MSDRNAKKDEIRDALWPHLVQIGKVSAKGELPLMCCEFHPDRTPSMSVNVRTGKWHCFSGTCNASGKDALDYLGRRMKGAAYDRRSDFIEVLERASKLTGIALDGPQGQGQRREFRPPRNVSVRPKLPERKFAQPLALDAGHWALLAKQQEYAAAFEGSPAAEYLRSRGLDPVAAAAFGFGYTPRWGGWGACLTFPTCIPYGPPPADKDNYPAGQRIILGISGRAIDPKAPKSSRHTKTSASDYGGHAGGWFNVESLREPLEDAEMGGYAVVLVESAIDAVSLFQGWGIPAAALCGAVNAKDIEPTWFTFTNKAPNIVLAFDSDPAGQEGAAAMERKLRDIRVSTHQKIRIQGPPTEVDGHPVKDWNDLLKLAPTFDVEALLGVKGVHNTGHGGETRQRGAQGPETAIPQNDRPRYPVISGIERQYDQDPHEHRNDFAHYSRDQWREVLAKTGVPLDALASGESFEAWVTASKPRTCIVFELVTHCGDLITAALDE